MVFPAITTTTPAISSALVAAITLPFNSLTGASSHTSRSMGSSSSRNSTTALTRLARPYGPALTRSPLRTSLTYRGAKRQAVEGKEEDGDVGTMHGYVCGEMGSREPGSGFLLHKAAGGCMSHWLIAPYKTCLQEYP